MNDMTLNNSNDVVYFSRLNWVIFFGPILALCMAIALAVFIHTYIAQLANVGLFFIAFAVLYIVMTAVTYYFSSVTVKTKQVILRTGVLVRQFVDIPLNKIETIDIRQSIMGSIFGYGSLLITGTGGTRHLISYLNNPLACRRHIEELMNKPL